MLFYFPLVRHFAMVHASTHIGVPHTQLNSTGLGYLAWR